MKLAVTFLSILVGLTAGCGQKNGDGGVSIASASEISPTAKIAEKAELHIAGIDIAVDVKQVVEGRKMTLDLLSFGQLFEREVYTFDDKTFNLLDAAGENYSEPLPLLKFPMKVGDTWKWSGTMTSGAAPHKATASVSTSSEQLLLTGGPTESILVIVDLEIDSGGPTPATRKLRFWFAKNKGLVKRQFGIGSTREPAG